MLIRRKIALLALSSIVFAGAPPSAQGQGIAPSDKLVVSYPSKSDGKNRLEAYQLVIDMARATQKIDRPIPAAQLIDETLLDELIREGGIKR